MESVSEILEKLKLLIREKNVDPDVKAFLLEIVILIVSLHSENLNLRENIKNTQKDVKKTNTYI